MFFRSNPYPHRMPMRFAAGSVRGQSAFLVERVELLVGALMGQGMIPGFFSPKHPQLILQLNHQIILIAITELQFLAESFKALNVLFVHAFSPLSSQY
jgi:hypothetical protein